MRARVTPTRFSDPLHSLVDVKRTCGVGHGTGHCPVPPSQRCAGKCGSNQPSDCQVSPSAEKGRRSLSILQTKPPAGFVLLFSSSQAIVQPLNDQSEPVVSICQYLFEYSECNSYAPIRRPCLA